MHALNKSRIRLEECICSDRSVGVEHHAELAAHGTWWQVVGKFGLDEARLSVGGGDFAPNAFVRGALSFVVSFEDVGDALSHVEKR